MFGKNKLAVICVIFTIITLFSSVLNLAQGRTGTDHFHILIRFLIVALAIGSLYIFDWFKGLSFKLVHLIHYIATLIAVFFLVWFTGLFADLHPDVYRDIFFNYTGVYVIIILVEIIYFKVKKKALFEVNNK